MAISNLISEWAPRLLQSRRAHRGRKLKQAQEMARAAFGFAPVRWLAAGAAAYGIYLLVQRFREESLEGKVVLITGGSRGLGFLLAHEFARNGCRIAICGRDVETLERAVRDLEHAGAEVQAVRCDLADHKDVEYLISTVTERFGRIDVLVNNAGFMQVGPVETVSEEDFRHAMEVMFWAPLRATLAVLPQMRDRGDGRIVNITSLGGMISVPHMLPYNCAKFAAVGLSEGLRAELCGHGIRVTTIVPGLMRLGSHYNAEFRGDVSREYRWFTLGATLPVISMNGRRAARQIVRATQRGQAFRVLGMPAAVLERIHGLAPAATARVLELLNRALPELVRHDNGAMRGSEIVQRLNSRLFESLTIAGKSAAEQSNQFSRRHL